MSSRNLLVLSCLLGGILSACTPPLKSELPQGQAAYDAVYLAADAPEFSPSRLVPGDMLSVRVFQEEDLSVDRTTVDPAGNLSLPLIGEVAAKGYTSSQLATAIEQRYAADFLRDPRVNVVLLESAPRIVAVEGEVKDPGIYPMQRGYTLLDAMALAGSPTNQAKLDEVLIFREIDGQRMGGRFDLIAIRSGRMPDPALLPNDTIVVGFSTVRGLYQDFLRTAPLIGAFSRF